TDHFPPGLTGGLNGGRAPEPAGAEVGAFFGFGGAVVFFAGGGWGLGGGVTGFGGAAGFFAGGVLVFGGDVTSLFGFGTAWSFLLGAPSFFGGGGASPSACGGLGRIPLMISSPGNLGTIGPPGLTMSAAFWMTFAGLSFFASFSRILSVL